MDWQWWYIILSLSASVGAFDCPEGVGCSSCQRYPEDIYEMDCATSNDDIIKVEIRSNDYVKLTCHNFANWSEFHLGSSRPISGVKTLSFNMCNLPKERDLGSIAKQLLTDNVETLTFSSYTNLSWTLTNESLRGFAAVKKLTLSSNNFTNLPSNLLENLASLTFLNLRDNNLRSLPRDFFRGKNLELIEISTNKLETLDSDTFGKLDRLRLLNIWDNGLVEISPNTFDSLTSLETLGLQRNKLQTLPTGIFSRLGNLKVINLSQNNFTSSLSADLLRNCGNLQSVVLMENRRNMTTLPDGFFANMTKLTSVKLRKIGLSSLPEDLFWGAVNLQNVSLERNYLSTLPRQIFRDNVRLTMLDLNFNDLSSLPDDVFANLKKLVKLDLSRNHLSAINEKLFSGLTSLRELNVERNDLISIHVSAFDSLQNLRVAKFSYNKLTLKSSWGTLGSPFRSSEHLEELRLDHNNISDIFEDWMYLMGAIRTLDLSYNKIRLVTDGDLQFLSQNLNVDLTHNEIRHINLDGVNTWALDRSYSRNVIISVDENPIECDCKLYDLLRYLEGRLHPNVQNAFHLKIGELKCGGPSELRGISIRDLKSKTLKCNLEATELESTCPSPQCKCKVRPENKAFIVDCANAGLTEAPSLIEGPFDYTIELNLSRNSLTAMPSFDQPGYDRITILALDHNNISQLSIDTLSPNLKVLRLNNNDLSRVDEAVINFLSNASQLSELALESNPWFCDCDARKFLRFIQEKSSKIPALLKVVCPGHELPVFQMTPEDLCPSDISWIIGACLGVAFFGIIVGILAAMYYRYQREIKIWLYAKNLCLWFVTEDELDKDKLFDAFISYSHKDEDFVVNDLIRKLETGPRPFKLCVHFRDWLAGEWIPKQIARSVEESRRTIVVLSPNFLESVWGRMEFRAAHSQALSEGRARVIVILYGDIGPTDDLDPELKAYLSMNTYVKWGDPWFWEKLNYAMPHPHEFSDRKFRRNVFETTQPRIETANDKSELINPPGAPSTPPIASTPPADSLKMFIVDEISNQKPSIGEMNNVKRDDSPIVAIANCGNKLSNGFINNVQHTTV